jgi:hypothetical protein
LASYSAHSTIWNSIRKPDKEDWVKSMTKSVGRKGKKERKKDGADFLENLLEAVARRTDISFKLI